MNDIQFDNERIDQYFKNNDQVNDKRYINELFCNKEIEKDLEHLLSRQFYNLCNEESAEEKDLNHILYKIHYDINTRLAERKKGKLVRLYNWSVKIAGIILLPLALFWGYKAYSSKSTLGKTLVEINAPAWTRAKFSLPDGSMVWLNSNSSIKYSTNFRNQRQVFLSGEAFFDVAKDSKRPFTVSANEVEVKVLGTRFNLASYDNEENIEVVLEEGSLVFTSKNSNKSCFMNPNDMVIFNKLNQGYKIQLVESQKYSAWTEGKLIFRNDPLDVVARRLERWYNIEVDVQGNIDRNPRLRATFVDENLEEVMDLLKRSLSIDYRLENVDLNTDETHPKKKLIIIVKPKKTYS